MPLTILSGSAQAAAVAGAADRIRHGGIVVFPTETVYGIGADIRCASAIEKAARLKNSPAGKPLLVHCCAVDQVQGLVAEIPAVAQVLMDRFWPGPLAMIFKSLPDVPAIVTAGTGKVGIRMVSHPGFSDFCARLGAPIAGTSANMHGEPATSVFAEIDPDLLAGVDAAIDAGICGSGHPSTVIDLTDDPPRLLRAGAVASERLQAALGLRLRT
ncbi:MAG: threonylcarbamoyl-AMP synthase [candidate division WOR-3 bacterium]|nr:MAG: threonylcarbamoyl-AMP synthase [candidate division WOR-3 bacterium]